MKINVCFFSKTAFTASLAVLCAAVAAQASSKEAPAKSSAKVANIHVVSDVSIPQSVFDIPSQASDGRNPFFPQSVVHAAPVKVNPGTSFDASVLVLNGITSPPKRTAMINGRTFEPGEEGEVRLSSGGKMLIKCEEIKAESATVVVGGQRRELRLRTGL